MRYKEDVKYVKSKCDTHADDSFHPAFGNIEISKVTGQGEKLVDTTGKVDEYFTLRISESYGSSVVSGKTNYYAGERLIEVKLSKSQLVDLMTNLNSGGGPCTINYIQNEKVPELGDNYIVGYDSLIAHTLQDLNRTEIACADNVDEFEEILKKKSINKKDREQLRMLFRQNTEVLTSNLKYFLQNMGKVSSQLVSKIATDVYDTVKTRIHTYKNSKTKLLGD
jgi:hypothetical protein